MGGFLGDIWTSLNRCGAPRRGCRTSLRKCSEKTNDLGRKPGVRRPMDVGETSTGRRQDSPVAVLPPARDDLGSKVAP